MYGMRNMGDYCKCHIRSGVEVVCGYRWRAADGCGFGFVVDKVFWNVGRVFFENAGVV